MAVVAKREIRESERCLHSFTHPYIQSIILKPALGLSLCPLHTASNQCL